jgi:hypothetical protein
VSSPTIGSDGTVYVGSDDKKLYAINGKSGVKLWESKTGSIYTSSPAIGTDGTVYVGSDDYKLYAINGKSGVKLWEFETGGSVESSPAIGPDGTVYVGSATADPFASADKKLYAIKTDSKGLAKSPWPMRGQNPQHTGRAVNTATEPTEPGNKKLTPAEVEKILAAQIGQWQVKGQLKPANEEPVAYEFTLNVQWKEKGKSISSTGTLEKAGEKISLFSHKEYDPVKGVFLFRFRDELRPEVLSHEQYDPATRTFNGRQVSSEEPEVTYTFQADGPDKFIFKMKTTRDDQFISTDESIQTRIATTVTEPTQPTEPASGGEDKSAKIIEAAIRKSLNKPEGGLTEANYEKVTELELNDNQLTEIPKGLEKLAKLEVLYLEGNKLTDVKGLEKLNQLTNLSLDVNGLTDVTELGKLKELKELNLGGNQLTNVKDLDKLTQLTSLDLGGNQLTEVPKELEELTKLKELWLHENMLTKLEGLENLTQLKKLYLEDNSDLTKAQIEELQRALPKCEIYHNAK